MVAMFINQLATEIRSKISSGACEGGGGDLQNRGIFDKVDGAVGGARGESGPFSVQPPVCWPEELNFGGFERPVPTRVDHLRGEVEPPRTVIPVPLCLMPVSVSDPFQASEAVAQMRTS